MLIDKYLTNNIKKKINEIKAIVYEGQKDAQYLLMYDDCLEIAKILDDIESKLERDYDAYNPNASEIFEEE